MSRTDAVTVAIGFVLLYARALKPREQETGTLETFAYAALVFYWASVVWTGRIWHV